MLFTVLLLSSALHAEEVSIGKCWGMGVAEFFVPGLGYALTGQYDKALVIGGSRWVTGNHAVNMSEREDYQDDPDDIYVFTDAEENEDEKYVTDIYMNRSTWMYNYYGGLYQNLTFFTIWDLYEHQCQPNTDAYGYAAAPLNVAHWGTKWQFWLPMAVLAYNYATYNEFNETHWYLGNGLTESQIRNDAASLYYSVGVGEEMLFRGTIQKSLYNTFKANNFSPGTSRHLAVFSSAAIFGLAHSGDGFSANAASAFLFGVYEGYVYQPAVEEYDLTTAIAIHAWWDILLFYTILHHSDFKEYEGEVGADIPIPLMKVSFLF